MRPTAIRTIRIIRLRYLHGRPSTKSGLVPECRDGCFGDFLERIRNERRVELAFEDHRFWDVRRWKIAPQTMDIYGVKIEKQNDGLIYTRQLVDKRTWSDKMYLYPVSNEELFKNPLLKQNPDW